MAMLVVNGVVLPNPSDYKVKLSDLDSEATTRNMDGELIRSRIRAGVYAIDATWHGVRRDTYRQIVDALSPAQFQVAFFDPNTASTKTAYMYAGDREGTLISYTDESRPQDGLWELSVSLVEY